MSSPYKEGADEMSFIMYKNTNDKCVIHHPEKNKSPSCASFFIEQINSKIVVFNSFQLTNLRYLFYLLLSPT